MTDDQLVAIAKTGDSQAIGLLYDKYIDAIYRFCYWQTNRNAKEAEDITHDVFIEMAKSVKNFKGEGAFKNWLYTIAKRQINKWIRGKYEKTLVPLFDNIPEPENMIDPEEQIEKVQLLEKLFDHLKPIQKKILQLRFLKNYTIKEVAAELNLTESNVKVTTHRSMAKLKQLAAQM